MFMSKNINLCIADSDGNEICVGLSGVKHFVANDLREGNIIDRMYLWRLDDAPATIAKRMINALKINSTGSLSNDLSPTSLLFHLECSYGAELFALINTISMDKI